MGMYSTKYLPMKQKNEDAAAKWSQKLAVLRLLQLYLLTRRSAVNKSMSDLAHFVYFHV